MPDWAELSKRDQFEQVFCRSDFLSVAQPLVLERWMEGKNVGKSVIHTIIRTTCET